VGEAEVVDAFKDFVGRSRREVATGLLERFGLEGAARSRTAEFGVKTAWQAYVRVRLRIYEALLSDRDLILAHRYPHNIALLQDLRGAGYRTGLATMSHTEQARRVLGILGLTDAFDAIATRDDVEHGKPDPEIDLLVARELGARPEDCLVIEDSPAGVAAGPRGRHGRDRRYHRPHPPEVPRDEPAGAHPGGGRPSPAAGRRAGTDRGAQTRVAARRKASRETMDA
jgi:HAD superfamily hydrolase (TIGR01509 family)